MPLQFLQQRRSLIIYGLAVIGIAFLSLLMLPYFVPIERVQQAAAVKISGLTGQDVTFSGASRRFSLPLPYFSLRNVQISGSHNGPALLRAPRIEATLTLASLFSSEVHISSLTIVNPKITLNTDAQGTSNWRSAASMLTLFNPHDIGTSGAKPPMLRVGNIKLVDGTILYTQDGTDTRTQFDNVNFTLFWPDMAKRLSARGSLTHDSQPVQFSASVQNPAALFQQDISPFDLSIDAKALKADLQGELFASPQLKMEASLRLSSPSLRDLASFPVPQAKNIPDTGAITATSSLHLRNDDIVLDNMNLQIGKSRAEGSLAFRSTGKRPFLQGTLDFDTADLRPFLETQLDSLITAQGWSLAPIKGDDLSSLDMDLRLSAKRLEIAKATILDAALSVLTRENRVEFSLGDGKIYDGQMSGRLVAETRLGGGVKTYGTLGLTDLSVGDALRELLGVVKVTGKGEVSLNLSGEGASAQAIFASLAGEARLRLNDGSIAGIDMAKLMSRAKEKPLEAFLEAGRGSSDVESASAHFNIAGGVATTDDTRMSGPGYRLNMTGRALLTDRSFDMRGELLPPLDAKQDFRLPFVLKGPWFGPNIAPDTGAQKTSPPGQ